MKFKRKKLHMRQNLKILYIIMCRYIHVLFVVACVETGSLTKYIFSDMLCDTYYIVVPDKNKQLTQLCTFNIPQGIIRRLSLAC